MLEIRNITKIYQSKSGNSVKALDNVSVSFPETGMVFILGKSGSGKSTLLNVIGGLDGCDSGEFIIKGKSSSQFAGSDFDAYRNTFIGFIFQEYNVLDEFTVGANIGLALELQGKKATNEQITDILRQVDMVEYAKRKPNELSGGQKQRVAIARALVKDPEIIMADEPTGALDSNTGKQIFDTLKELSRTKLVIIVSHDRDFAEKYADRIIEMKDGQILSDVTKHEMAAEVLSSGILRMNSSLLRIEKGYQLTAKDMELINAYLRAQSTDILLSGDARVNDSVRSAAGISQNNNSAVFKDTDEQKDVKVKSYQGTKFIRSRLPMKNALKMGGSSLKHKKFRLVVTILLSMIAFTLFGFADTLGAYNKMVAATDSIIDSNVQSAAFSLGLKHTWTYEDHVSSYYENVAMNEDDLRSLSERTGITFVPVFNGSSQGVGGNISLTDHMTDRESIASDSAYTGNLYGLTTVGTEDLRDLGFSVVGHLPAAADEIAISELMYNQFNLTGFENDAYNETVKKNELTMDANGGEKSIIGKHISIRVNDRVYTFKITAVINTAFDYERYREYVPANGGLSINDNDTNDIIDMIMQQELENTLRYGFHSLGYITKATLDDMASYMKENYTFSYIGTQMNWSASLVIDFEAADEKWSNHLMHLTRVGQSADMSAVGQITWLDGERAQLGENEMLVSNQLFSALSMNRNVKEQFSSKLETLFGSYWQSSYHEYIFADGIRQASVEEYIDKNFTALRGDLLTKYEEYHHVEGMMPSDEELRSFWRDVLMNSWNDWIPTGSKTGEEIWNDAYRKAVRAVLEYDFDETLPDDFYSVVIQQYFESGSDEFLLSTDMLRYVLIYEYAFSQVYDHPELYNSQAFFDSVLANRYKDISAWNEIDNAEKARTAAQLYAEYIRYGSVNGINEFGDRSNADFYEDSMRLYAKLTGNSMEEYLDQIYLSLRIWDDGEEEEKKYTNYRIVGLFDGGHTELVISDTLYAAHESYRVEYGYGLQTVAPHAGGVYAYALAPMPADRATIEKLVAISYEEGSDLRFSLQNQVMNTLSNFNDFIEVGTQIFLYVGIGFAVFSALMLMNFISVSISYKRREIGILRAVGARSSDVFKIFFCEAFIIALINYVLSLIATIVTTTVFNSIVRNYGINVTLLSFGIRQIALMLIISVFVAALASFLPVWNIARRKPVDAIKNK